jgi:DNA primase
VQILRRFASRIILLFDGDAAGQKAAQRGALVLAPHPLDVKVLLLPSTDDPDSFVKKHGAEKFRAIALGAMPAQDYVIDKACAEHDPATPHGKSAIIAMLTPLMQAMTDSIIRQEFVKKLSERLNVRETTILERAKAPTGPAAAVEKVPDQVVVANYLSTPEGKFVRLVAMYPQLTELASQHVSPETLSDPVSADLYSTLLRGWQNGEGFDAVAHRISDPEKQRVLSLIAVSQPPDNEHPEEELAHTMRQIERNFLKRRLSELRRQMTIAPENTALLVQEHMKLAARLSELDKQR